MTEWCKRSLLKQGATLAIFFAFVSMAFEKVEDSFVRIHPNLG